MIKSLAALLACVFLAFPAFAEDRLPLLDAASFTVLEQMGELCICQAIE